MRLPTLTAQRCNIIFDIIFQRFTIAYFRFTITSRFMRIWRWEQMQGMDDCADVLGYLFYTKKGRGGMIMVGLYEAQGYDAPLPSGGTGQIHTNRYYVNF